MSLNITVNGTSRTVNAEPLTPLLHVLREELDVLSPKAGCQNGGCGTCTVLVDGEPRRSCLIPISAVEGAEIRTVEGLAPPGQLSTLQEAWIHHYAAQCGFCTSGFLMAATAYLENGGSDDHAEIATALGGHVCRCTGYVKILDAISAAARGDSFDLTTTAAGLRTTIKGVDQ
ncbi:MAG: (2Fe-2S)-binding protein [Thermoleophilia bacterium]|nr:(2Fe-2S)-binding protein [Thermoleophilia bacterium]